jgi:hypothetical protein
MPFLFSAVEAEVVLVTQIIQVGNLSACLAGLLAPCGKSGNYTLLAAYVSAVNYRKTTNIVLATCERMTGCLDIF